MLKAAIPLIHARTAREALDFYCGKLGFALRSTYRPGLDDTDPAYHVLVRDGAVVHVSSFPGDGVAGGVVTIPVDDIEALCVELAGRGVDVGAGIMEQSWGDREVYVEDPTGNTLRFQSA